MTPSSRPRWTRLLPALTCWALSAVAGLAQEAAPAQVPPPPAAVTPVLPVPAVCAKVWIGHEAEYEELLRHAPIARRERIPIGVTHPERLFFAPGLPVASAAWKPLAPGRYRGFQESYGSEIAAYELDKLIGLQMVPPSVERWIGGRTGAVILWVEHVKAWDVKEDIRGPDPVAWVRELSRMQMFDTLSGNIDRNQGNLLYDAEYHIVLIDHSRAFVDVQDLSRFKKFVFVDRALWERMRALTAGSLQGALGRWVGKGMLAALLKRRECMQAEIDRMRAVRGDDIWLR